VAGEHGRSDAITHKQTIYIEAIKAVNSVGCCVLREGERQQSKALTAVTCTVCYRPIVCLVTIEYKAASVGARHTTPAILPVDTRMSCLSLYVLRPFTCSRLAIFLQILARKHSASANFRRGPSWILSKVVAKLCMVAYIALDLSVRQIWWRYIELRPRCCKVLRSEDFSSWRFWPWTLTLISQKLTVKFCTAAEH